MRSIEQTAAGWKIRGAEIVLDIDRRTGCLASLTIARGQEHVWSRFPGDVVVRDDVLERSFGRAHLQRVTAGLAGGVLTVEKSFRGAPWRLIETYRVDDGYIAWKARIELARGPFRSCAISYRIPWPQPLYPVAMWAARDNMPSAPHRFGAIALEYGEITSGILMPAAVFYHEQQDMGLALHMPFEFKTPRLRFLSGYREPDLMVEFDRLALSVGRPAHACLLMRGAEGAWRPTLGRLYERYREYFEPRSTRIHELWGGHVSGECDVSLAQARSMARLGLRWHEIHRHFPAYGDYHPEDSVTQWKTGHHPHQFTKWITPEMVRRTIRNLHAVGAAALPYIQVGGDGAVTGPGKAFPESCVRDLYGDLIYDDFYKTYQMNSDPSLPYGQDIRRQIAGMVGRYPEMDGVFLDQACYNYLDTAHDDGVTAFNNRPAYMTGYTYAPHLEHLSALLHPKKVIIGNGPFSIGIMKYIDGFMAEGSGWLCDLMQYYSLAKPMFFLLYHTTDRDIELMFQRCLLYGAGFSSYPAAMPSKGLYDRYLPLVQRLYRRRWVFDPKPVAVPTGFKGSVYRGANGSLMVSVIGEMSRSTGRRVPDNTIMVHTADAARVRRVTVQQPGGKVVRVPFSRENGAIQFTLPGRAVAALAELQLRGE
ncbi:MAG: hypothetical protein PHR35_00260 [Kiritimatiellae bacterium]|nr:hypothetical protein [Kiritimatiellia bacterium]